MGGATQKLEACRWTVTEISTFCTSASDRSDEVRELCCCVHPWYSGALEREGTSGFFFFLCGVFCSPPPFQSFKEVKT